MKEEQEGTAVKEGRKWDEGRKDGWKEAKIRKDDRKEGSEGRK